MSSTLFHGIEASPGIGIGKVFLLEKDEFTIVKAIIRKEDIKKEIRRFRRALEKAKKDLEADKSEMLRVLGKSHARLADAYLLILEDPILSKDIEKEIAKEGVNAEYAIQSALNQISHSFDALQDEYFRERKNDIIEVGHKILRHLLGKGRTKMNEITEEAVIVAHNLLPSDTVLLKMDLIRGFVIDVGGKTSHTALLAQSLEIPAVVGLKDITTHVKSGQMMIIDGSQGLVILEPDKLALENALREKQIQVHERQELIKLKNVPAQTLDGKRIELSANIEAADESKAAVAYGAEGVGLFRTEYLFMNRPNLPTEEEQYHQYIRVVKKMAPCLTIFRTLDVGGDKLAPFVNGLSKEANPFLGLRALRFCLKYPEIFRVQLRAILRTSIEGKIRIMFPMVSSIQEFKQGKEIFESVKKQLIAEGIPISSHIEVGAMIEVPSAALTADIIAQDADFLSLGTNDLIQYTLAVDRVNENVASLYEPMHLSILRLIKMVIEAGHKQGKWVGMCGEMASDFHFTQLLLGLGLDELSVAPSFIPRIKKIIRSTNFSEAKRLATGVLSSTDYAEVQKRLIQMKLALI